MWLHALELASEWGVPPWEIAGGGNRLTWIFRGFAYLKLRKKRDGR